MQSGEKITPLVVPPDWLVWGGAIGGALGGIFGTLMYYKWKWAYEGDIDIELEGGGLDCRLVRQELNMSLQGVLQSRDIFCGRL